MTTRTPLPSPSSAWSSTAAVRLPRSPGTPRGGRPRTNRRRLESLELPPRRHQPLSDFSQNRGLSKNDAAGLTLSPTTRKTVPLCANRGQGCRTGVSGDRAASRITTTGMLHGKPERWTMTVAFRRTSAQPHRHEHELPHPAVTESTEVVVLSHPLLATTVSSPLKQPAT